MARALNNYHQIVQELLYSAPFQNRSLLSLVEAMENSGFESDRSITRYSQIPYLQEDLKDETIFDCNAGRYMLVTVGWQGRKRINTIVLYIDVRDEQVIIQCNNTDQNIADELAAVGIRAPAIVFPQRPVAQSTMELVAA